MTIETPELPPIKELTVDQANRLICADYLRTIAELIQGGKISAFDLAWGLDYTKPAGKLVTTAGFLVAPVEAKFLQAVADFRAKNIQVVDVTEKLKDHQPCEGEAKEDCALCNTKLS